MLPAALCRQRQCTTDARPRTHTGATPQTKQLNASARAAGAATGSVARPCSRPFKLKKSKMHGLAVLPAAARWWHNTRTHT